jgi:hypothetical protein
VQGGLIFNPTEHINLSFVPKQYAFLGYSDMCKGYKCLDIATSRVYISCDIVFDEAIFPVSNLHPNAGKHLHDELLLFPDHFHDEAMNFCITNVYNALPESL